MKNFLARNKLLLTWTGLGAAGVIAFLAFAVFEVQTLVIDKKVDESGPVFASGASAASATTEPTTTAPTLNTRSSAQPTSTASPTSSAPPSTASPTSAAPQTSTARAGVVVERSGGFTNRAHDTLGEAQVLGDGTGQRFLRFEDFETSNGPDLRVYLSAAPTDAIDGEFDDDFVDLGGLKGNIGSQNYEIPGDADLDTYNTVVIWCVRFRVPFGVAALTVG